jgi:diguanylate cyclase (GGDEF)-like protein/PAS domain S-box-containing protein
MGTIAIGNDTGGVGMRLTTRRYQAALANQLYGVVLVDEHDTVEFVNQRFCDAFGLDTDPSDLVGLTAEEFSKLMAPAYADPAGATAHIDSIRKANVRNVGDEVLMRDGRTMLVDFTPIMVDGKPSGRMWQHRDITEVKRAREELRLSEEKFSKAFQIASYGIAIARMGDGQFLEVNDAFVSMSGYPRGELVGRSSLAMGLWVDEADRDSVVSALRDGRAVAEQKMHFRKKYGEILTTLFSAQVVNLSQGPCILASIGDISALERTEQELQRSRRWLSDLIEHSGALICVKDRVGRYELVNSRWEQVTGLKREDTIGRTDEELFPGPSAKQFRLNDVEAMKSQTELEIEETLEDTHGKRFFISIKFPLYGEYGTVTGICGMMTEITARKEAEEKVRYLATHDGLTNLPNLGLAKDRLTMALGVARRHNTMVAVMFIDLDGFKAVNDTLGHEAGDRVLEKTAQRMTSCVRETDTVARVGGDEFLIVATGLRTQGAVVRIAEKVVRRVAEPVILDDGQRASVSASVGIALCRLCGEDSDRLIKAADAAMYRVKNSGKNGYRIAEEADS